MPRLEALNALLKEPRTLIMGVLNVTPDSFSDGGEFLDPTVAALHVKQMIAEGADIIDIGGQSTRPSGKTYGAGAEEVSGGEELKRVIPVLRAVAQECPDALYSIDTVRSSVAREAIAVGADIINDVSAGTSDPEMFATAAGLRAPMILMHGHGPEFTKEKIEDYNYTDVTGEVVNWLHERLDLAREAGVPLLTADCGFGFAKSAEYNVRLVKEHARFSALGVPMVLGVSRKSTIGKLLGGNILPKDRVYGSIGAGVYGSLNGAKIIRTHDVKATREALHVVDGITNSR